MHGFESVVGPVKVCNVALLPPPSTPIFHQLGLEKKGWLKLCTKTRPNWLPWTECFLVIFYFKSWEWRPLSLQIYLVFWHFTFLVFTSNHLIYHTQFSLPESRPHNINLPLPLLYYRKIPKRSPVAYIFQRPFLRGLCTEGNLRFKIDWASL